MPRFTLKLPHRTSVITTIEFITIVRIQTILIHVTEESPWDTASISTLELGFGAGAVAGGAGREEFV